MRVSRQFFVVCLGCCIATTVAFAQPQGGVPKRKGAEVQTKQPRATNNGQSDAVARMFSRVGRNPKASSPAVTRDVVVDYGNLKLGATSLDQIASLADDCVQELVPPPSELRYKIGFDPLLSSPATESGGMMIGRIRLAIQRGPLDDDLPEKVESEMLTLLEKACKLVDDRLQKAAESLKEQLSRDRELSALALEERKRYSQLLHANLDALWTRAGVGAAGSRESQIARIADLFTQRIALKQEIAGAKARQRRLEEHVARIQKEAEARGADDRTIGALQTVLNSRRAELEFRRKQMTPEFYNKSALVRDLESKVAEAEAELSKERAIAVRAAGASQLTPLKVDLVQTDVKIAESEAKLEALETTIKLAPDSNEVASLTSSLELARAAVAKAEERDDAALQALNRFRSPRLILLKTEGPKAKKPTSQSEPSKKAGG